MKVKREEHGLTWAATPDAHKEIAKDLDGAANIVDNVCTEKIHMGSKVNQTIGKNKSGMPWKKRSSQSTMHNNFLKKSYDQKM